MQRDATTRDLTFQKLRIATDVRFWPVQERGKLVYRLEIPALHRFFRVGFEEYVFISCLNGQRTIPQACGIAAASLGRRSPTAQQALEIARWLLQNDLAVLSHEPMPVRDVNRSTSRQPINPTAKWISKLNPFWIKIRLPRMEAIMNGLARRLAVFLDGRAVAVGICTILVAMMMLFAHSAAFATASATLIHPSNWFWLLVSWVFLKIIHELAHAIACHRQGASVRESGFVLVLLAPMAYVDVSSCWRLRSHWARILVASAGMYVELVVAALAVLLWVWTDDPLLRYHLHHLAFAAGVSTLIFNANALMRFDGYYILADLIEVPNLYQEASSAVSRLLLRLATGERTPTTGLTGWRRHFVLLYGLAALVWRVTVCISLGIAASTMLQGAGLLIAAFGVWLWLSGPIRRLLQFMKRVSSRRDQWVRTSLVLGVLGAGVLVAFFGVPLTTSIQVPTVTQHLPETTIRSGASGFVSGVFAKDGSIVRKGDLLIKLDNPRLMHQLRSLELSHQQGEIRLLRAIGQHDPNLQQVLKEKQDSITKQLNQVRDQVAGLSVVATRDGIVIGSDLEERLGTYVEEGEHLMNVAASSDKELIAWIPQTKIESVRSWVGTEVAFQTADHFTHRGHLVRVEPRATVHLQDTVLAAVHGGPCAVEQVKDASSEDSLRLTEPHFRARIALDPNVASDVPVGMRVVTEIGYRRATVATRIRHALRSLWQSAHASAAH